MVVRPVPLPLDPAPSTILGWLAPCPSLLGTTGCPHFAPFSSSLVGCLLLNLMWRLPPPPRAPISSLYASFLSFLSSLLGHLLVSGVLIGHALLGPTAPQNMQLNNIELISFPWTCAPGSAPGEESRCPPLPWSREPEGPGGLLPSPRGPQLLDVSSPAFWMSLCLHCPSLSTSSALPCFHTHCLISVPPTHPCTTGRMSFWKYRSDYYLLKDSYLFETLKTFF